MIKSQIFLLYMNSMIIFTSFTRIEILGIGIVEYFDRLFIEKFNVFTLVFKNI